MSQQAASPDVNAAPDGARPRQALRTRAGAVPGRPRPACRTDHRALRRQRRRQVRADPLHLRHPSPRPRTDLLGGAPGAHQQPARGVPAGHRDRLPGPRPGGQPRHRPEHVPGARTSAARLSRRGRHGAGGQQDAGRPARHDGAIDPPAGGVAVRRPAPVGGGGEGGDVELQARHPRRAHRRARRGADQAGPRPGATPPRQRPGGDADLAQPQRRLRGGRPGRGAPPRAHGRPGPGVRLRPAEPRRVHDDRGSPAGAGATGPAQGA